MHGVMFRIGSIGACLAVVALGGCNPFSGPSPLEPMTLDPQEGTVRVERQGDVVKVTGRFSLAPGDVIKTAESGARLKLEGRRLAWVRGGSRVRVEDGRTLHNLYGSVLVRTEDETSVIFDDVTASSSDGTFRVDRGTAASSAATYRGTTVVRAPGQAPIAVKSLFASSSAAGGVLDVVPYRVDPADPWDRLELARVIELDAELKDFSGALAARLDGRDVTEHSLSKLARRRNYGWMTPYLDERAAADVLIAVAIARTDSPPGTSLRPHFTAAFDLRDDDAPWGVVATIMGADPNRLIAGLQRIVSDTGIATGNGGEERSSPSGANPGSGIQGALRSGAVCSNMFDCLLDMSAGRSR
jgi:hypothetical protein